MLKIALLDQDEYSINGLRHYFDQPTFTVTAHPSLAALRATLKSEAIDTVIMELFTHYDSFYDCVEFARTFSLYYPHKKLVVFTQIATPALIRYVVSNMNNSNVVLKNDAIQQLANCIFFNARDNGFNSSTQVKVLKYGEYEDRPITPCEWKVLRYFSQGFSPSAIGDRLNISIKTISHHKRNLMNKMKCKDSISFYLMLNNIRQPHRLKACS